MRTNLPVTGREHRPDPQDILVSATSLDSHIRYCNPAFVRASGFESEELLGQPHNLIRHPDMPPEAFRDLWATLKAGRPWSGLIKNRRKDGDHYWVRANVTPMLEAGRPVGYMSVRSIPSRAEVEAAEALYARMREDQRAARVRLALRGGHVVRAGWRGRLAALSRPGLGACMTLALAALAVASAGVAVLTEGRGPLAMGLGLAAQAGAVAGLAAWLTRRITRPLAACTQMANRMAAGELRKMAVSGRRDGIGELEGALAQLNVNLQAMVGDVRTAATDITEAAAEMGRASADLSVRTEAQAASLEQTAAAIDQIAATVRRNADSATSATQQSVRAGEVAERGSAVVGQVVAGMRGIEGAAGRIASINSVVDGIAFQTNLLALNAAVEAARAGEQGRGFAVVAQEVRGLAQRSADAARQIRDLVEETRRAVGEGVGTAGHAGKTLDEVLQAAREVGSLVEGISHASSEQSTGIGEVNAAVAQLDAATQQNAAMVQRTSASASQLASQAEGLRDAVKLFRVLEETV
ncbi:MULTISPECIES: PAS domain-containing methyl-accepting chemotaxis protein [Ramlibacter]|uniref:PAS domain-containing protein n=1 Tax=Ramlibacter aquaticus TaxID=2780094 RepID=A0ABR9SA98_9BURK|nr:MULTISPECIES: PAS domain-containing methyl-accepting chemotaxis protein [Ramlibacter]MBE7939280.1 PAS domain-containing protein [Ramlibacter aquaticus]